jgi:hypothetical protein
MGNSLYSAILISHICKLAYQNWWILSIFKLRGNAHPNSPHLSHHSSTVPCSPTEASRALRKKLKHGDTHQRYRALVIRGYLSYALKI